MQQRERFLILEDDVAFARLLTDVLQELGSSCSTESPERLPELIESFQPTLIIVDYNLNHPTLNGLDTTRIIKQIPQTAAIPVMLLSGEDDMTVIEEAFKSGIEDYVLKPVVPRFLVAKIENMLFQSRKKLNAQALSGLPGNAAIEREFDRRLQLKTPFSVAYTDLDHFKPFNDEKGVKRGDEAIQLVSKILYDLRSASSREQLFVGHIGGDDFILMGTRTVLLQAVKKLRSRFLRETQVFFTASEIKAKKYPGIDRQGRACEFPLLDLSTAVVHSVKHSAVADFLRLTELVAKLKKDAKNAPTRIAELNAIDFSPPITPNSSLFTAPTKREESQERIRKI